MTRAPRSLANCAANSDTPPVPKVTTVSPARTPDSAFHAVTPAQGSVAASANDRCRGIGTSALCGSTTNSASMPSSEPPSWGRCSGPNGPSSQLGNKPAVTRSPTRACRTPGPSATTSPAPSDTGTTFGLTGRTYVPRSTSSSRKLSDTARTATSTSPYPGTGVASSHSANPSIPPPLVARQLRIEALYQGGQLCGARSGGLAVAEGLHDQPVSYPHQVHAAHVVGFAP